MRRDSTRISPRCRRRCGTGPIVRSRFDGTGFRKARASGARSGFRRCGTASCKPPCAWCWNRSSTRRLPRTATAFVRSAARKMRCVGWTTLLRAGYRYVVDADLQAYFDSIPHAPLRARVQSKVSDGAGARAARRVPAAAHLRRAGAVDASTRGPRKARSSVPLLANLYLDPLDHAMAAAGFEMVRYADDFVVLCRTAEDAQRALALVQRWTEAAGLRLHPEKTHLVDMQQPGGFDFLGYHFERGHRWPRTKSLQEAQRRGAPEDPAHQRAQPRGHHRGRQPHAAWAGLGTSNTVTARSTPLDAWIRMRLRSILRKRAGRRGRGRGRGPSALAQSPSLRRRGCFPWRQPMRRAVSPRRR